MSLNPLIILFQYEDYDNVQIELMNTVNLTYNPDSRYFLECNDLLLVFYYPKLMINSLLTGKS